MNVSADANGDMGTDMDTDMDIDTAVLAERTPVSDTAPAL